MTAAHPARGAAGRGRLAALVPVVAFLGLLVLYEALRDLVEPATMTAALEHARQVIDAERSLGLFVEPDVHAFVNGSGVLRFLSTWFYTLAYTGGFILFFVWLWLRRRDRFWFVFAWFWATNLIAVIGYWLYPLAPPRLAGLGLEGTTERAIELGGSMKWFEPFRNELAAMPSMHFGQSMFFALALTLLLTSRWRWLWWIWPALMLLTVMATANHFWLDAAGGAAAVTLGLGVATLLARPIGLRAPWWREPSPVPAGATA